MDGRWGVGSRTCRAGAESGGDRRRWLPPVLRPPLLHSGPIPGPVQPREDRNCEGRKGPFRAGDVVSSTGCFSLLSRGGRRRSVIPPRTTSNGSDLCENSGLAGIASTVRALSGTCMLATALSSHASPSARPRHDPDPVHRRSSTNGEWPERRLPASNRQEGPPSERRDMDLRGAASPFLHHVRRAVRHVTGLVCRTWQRKRPIDTLTANCRVQFVSVSMMVGVA